MDNIKNEQHLKYKELFNVDCDNDSFKLEYDGNLKKPILLKLLQEYKENYKDDFFTLEELKQNNEEGFKNYINFLYDNPLTELFYNFNKNGFIDKKFRIIDQNLIDLGSSIFTEKQVRNIKKFTSGIIFPDGKFFVAGRGGHYYSTKWFFLNDVDLTKCVRVTDSTIYPIFSSLNEYVKLDDNNLVITDKQARAIYNIYQSQDINGCFDEIMSFSNDICLHSLGDPDIRYKNALTFESALGKDIFNSREVMRKINKNNYLMQFSHSYDEPEKE